MVLLLAVLLAAAVIFIRRVTGKDRKRLSQLRRAFQRLEQSWYAVKKQDRSQKRLLPSEEWLMDNFYLVEELNDRTTAFLKSVKSGRNGRRLAKEAYDASKNIVEGLSWNIDEKAFFIRLLSCCADWEEGVLRQMEGWCGYHIFMRLAEVSGWEEDRRAKETAVCIGSIRQLKNTNWAQLLENVSPLEKILLEDPANVYRNMDLRSKAYYRREASQIAYKNKISPQQAAQEAVRLARRPDAETKKERHVGYYLIGDGKKKLLTALGIRSFAFLSSDKKVKIYAGLRFLLAFIGCGEAFLLARFLGASFAWSAWTAGLSLIPVCAAVSGALHWLMLLFARAKPIPAMSLSRVPAEGSTFVVIPALLTGKDQVRKMVQKLETLYHAGPADNLYFAILGDLKDSEKETQPEDSEIVRCAVDGVQKLNQTYTSRFFYFGRRRSFDCVNQRYLGWERKRGALLEFVRLLHGEKTSYDVIAQPTEILPKVSYVITLDSDTCFLKGSAQKLIGAMLHPLNRPEIDQERGIVMKGYGLLQPRIQIKMEDAERTPFSRTIAGKGGIDAYSSAAHNLYQDYFGTGIFTGKGIFDVEAYYQVLDRALPTHSILSHDLLEGSYLRAGYLSSVVLEDGHPAKIFSYMKRLHRWTRGDWQLLPYLLPRVKTENGEKRKNGLSFLSRYQIMDNLCRSLEYPAVLVLLLFAAVAPLYTGAAPLFAALWFLAAPILLALASAVIQKTGKGKNTEKSVSRVLKRCGLIILFLPYLSFYLTDAIMRALWRTWVSRKNMLEWVTAEETEQTAGHIVFGYDRLLAFQPVSSAAFLLPVVFGTGCLRLLFFFIAAVWMFAPSAARRLGKTCARADILERADKEFLRQIAQKTWNYFDTFCGESENYLPPDNFQKQPYRGAAHRTSPTNIGMLLASYVAAWDFGWIDAETMKKRIRQTLHTVKQLEKCCGHLYNWYDTQTLKPLFPKFVSTVDSGNFACLLIAVKQAVAEAGGDARIAEQIEHIFMEMDFRFLYDSQKQLFSIGYDAEKQELSSSYYDLLASEARQASFLAIARGEIPESNWYRLGRKMTGRGELFTLVSWTGTMFEYAMPPLLMPSHEKSLLGITCRNMIKEQKRYAKKFGLPVWGISECAFCIFDRELNYQYKALGVPALSLKRDLHRDLVMSPYSACLALAFDPKGAAENLRAFCSLGAHGEFGMFESVDFTNGHLGKKEAYRIVKCYMAHHQGMSLIALDNVLNGNVFSKRFFQEPFVRAARYLLDEPMPDQIAVLHHSKTEELPNEPENGEPLTAYKKRFRPGLEGNCYFALENGAARLILDGFGKGSFFAYDREIYRMERSDPTVKGGHFIFVKPSAAERWENVTDVPQTDLGGLIVEHTDGAAKYFRQMGTLSCRIDVTLAAEDAVEIREITVKNEGTDRTIEIMDYLEVVLTSAKEDQAHPAFSNLFIQTSFLKQEKILSAGRRPRTSGGKKYFAALGVSVMDELSYETSRIKWIGRNRTLRRALALEQNELGRTVGTVLDPVLSLRTKFVLRQGEEKTVRFVLAVSKEEEKAKSLCLKYRDMQDTQQEMQALRERSLEQLRALQLKPEDPILFFSILSCLMEPQQEKNEIRKPICRNSQGQEGLWKFGISGDWPILLYCVSGGGDEMECLVQAVIFFRRYFMETECVILQESCEGYYNELEVRLDEALAKWDAAHLKNRRGGVYLLKGKGLAQDDRALLMTAAAIIFEDKKPIAQQLKKNRAECGHVHRKPLIISQFHEAEKEKTAAERLKFYNGYGGFDDKDYVIRLSGKESTPQPWSHIVANDRFGFLATESGGGYTWAENAREQKLTPWSNDAVCDPLGEILWIQDEAGNCFSPLKGAGDDGGCYEIRYGFGFCCYEHHADLIAMQLQCSVAETDPVKFSVLSVTNRQQKTQQYRIYYAVKPVLGVSAKNSRMMSFQQEGVLCAQNIYQKNADRNTLFLAATLPFDSYTGDGTEFFAQDGTLLLPRAPQLNGKMGFLAHSCLGGCVSISLQAGKTAKIGFMLGCCDETKVQATAAKYADSNQMEKESTSVKNLWQKRLGQIKITTPNPAFDQLVNGWLLYQTWACRLLAKTAFYQCGGATGYRDQIQDSLALIDCAPERTREQILCHAAHQFPEGDVLHWWHEGENGESCGVRTRFSDDRLWLPYVLGQYIRKTGDIAILKEKVSYLAGETLKSGENERYITARCSGFRENVYLHAQKALKCSMACGAHGLPLMGCGDWNDGMNSVGEQGRGESVWLGWFLAAIIRDWIPISKTMDDRQFAQEITQYLQELEQNLNLNAWDGEWFRRAYFDDGTPLGTKNATECQIDSISQSWAVLSGAAETEKCQKALLSARRLLIDEKHKLIKLLSPPFDCMRPSPGYIQGYAPGIRENGGQYTHAALWLIMAYARMGPPGEAERLWDMINPIRHTETKTEADRFETEPYVISADVYTALGLEGKGGWSWYTGAAGWMYRVAVEEILGIKREENRIYFKPCPGKGWDKILMDYRYYNTTYRFILKPGGQKVEPRSFLLQDDGKHHEITVEY